MPAPTTTDGRDQSRPLLDHRRGRSPNLVLVEAPHPQCHRSFRSSTPKFTVLHSLERERERESRLACRRQSFRKRRERVSVVSCVPALNKLTAALSKKKNKQQQQEMDACLLLCTVIATAEDLTQHHLITEFVTSGPVKQQS